jgi:hypothetical protein
MTHFLFYIFWAPGRAIRSTPQPPQVLVSFAIATNVWRLYGVLATIPGAAWAWVLLCYYGLHKIPNYSNGFLAQLINVATTDFY